MKLLTRISRSYMIISLIVFLISGMVVYPLLKHIFRKQMDESLQVEQMLVEQTINYSDSVPDFRVIFGHMIDVTILNDRLPKNYHLHDTLMYDPETGEFAWFRHLHAQNTSIREKGYTINIYKSLRETEHLMAEIILAIALLFISLMVTLIIANYFIARRVWIPFYRVLSQLEHYQIDKATPLSFSKTSIHEFNLLKEALEKMSLKISRDYQNLKEFNENASHELQTPLAIIKSKLELLIQKENLDENQMKLISNIMDATRRISRLNQGLLLISKIENNQFPVTGEIRVPVLIRQILDGYSDMLSMKEIRVSFTPTDFPRVNMNLSLAETFFNNLISNAIKHNIPGGIVEIHSDRQSVTIINNGPELKLPPERMFERFRKTEHHDDSTGLGLSIVKKIAELYHFDIRYTHSGAVHSVTVNFCHQPLQN